MQYLCASNSKIWYGEAKYYIMKMPLYEIPIVRETRRQQNSSEFTKIFQPDSEGKGMRTPLKNR